MAIPRKSVTYINNKTLSTYYTKPKRFKTRQNLWCRGTKISLLWLYKICRVHKGMYWGRVKVHPTQLNSCFGMYTLTRKPLAHPLKKGKV